MVKEFKYVGSVENDRATMDAEIKTRSQKMQAAFWKLSVNVFDNKNLTLAVKLEAFETFVMPCWSYGCETWNSLESNMRALEGVQFRLLRRIFGYRWQSFKSFSDLIEESRLVGVVVLPMEAYVRRARLTYFGHICRMNDARLPKMVMFSEMAHGQRRVGGQQQTWKRCLKRDFQLFNIPREWQDLVLDRSKWRGLVKTFGVRFFMENWERRRAEKGRGRDVARLVRPFVTPRIREPNVSVDATILVERAIISGAVVTGRGSRERQGGRRSVIREVFEPYAKRLLNALPDVEAVNISTPATWEGLKISGVVTRSVARRLGGSLI